jgi:hypothetical protein
MGTTVPRVVATLLIALTGLMALLPQAMCPCSTLRRAESVKAPTASLGKPAAAVEQGCCPLCRARTKAARTDSAPTKAPEAPSPCPCCRINGQGKTLVLRGDVVRPEPLVAAGFAFLPTVAVLIDVAAVTAGREAPPDVLARPPSERRAGVVLLI